MGKCSQVEQDGKGATGRGNSECSCRKRQCRGVLSVWRWLDNIQACGLVTSWIRGCYECGEEQVERRQQGHFEYTELEKLEGYYTGIEDWDMGEACCMNPPGRQPNSRGLRERHQLLP